MSTWHPAYREGVLANDYRFAAENLLHHFVDAMTAHLDTVLRMPAYADADTQAQGAELRRALVALHDAPAPEQAPDVPDLYFALQRTLEAQHGDAVGLIRVGLSRNDLDMTVYKMNGRAYHLEVGRRLLRLRELLLERAERHLETVLIAETHHQPGQPTTVAHYLGAVEDQLARDSERLLQAYARMNRSPLGAAALAGSSHPLDREFTARRLGFDAPVANTYDAVASADWEFDLVSVAQSVALGAGRFVTDLLAWAASGRYRLGDDLVQGSSIMPQKRNPVSLEHARTKFSRVVGAAGMFFFSSHNIPFTDLNDFGPDIQGALTAQHRQLRGALDLLAACLEGGDFDERELAEVAAATDTTATELADVLAREHGLSFPAAHGVAAKLVRSLSDQGRPLTTATPADLEAAGGPRLAADEVTAALDPAAFVRRRAGLGMPAPEVMSTQLARARERLEADATALRERKRALDRAIAQLRGEKEKA